MDPEQNETSMKWAQNEFNGGWALSAPSPFCTQPNADWSFNDLMSPTMCLYVLLCSITLCCSVVQLISKEATASQRLWIVQYSSGQILQLFLFCWHANELFLESQNIDGGVYASDWWKADVRMRKQILLLADCTLECYDARFSFLTDIMLLVKECRNEIANKTSDDDIKNIICTLKVHLRT
ncbi:unnamed protein product [Chilo suppressalis]|uniref:Odorant receptor n=1 Tax=Chilo suppressalis TaxID=168631 RepID=A0ABN8B0P7_CHISP|nr:unnamed protein product [Chilo suppressalis]